MSSSVPSNPADSPSPDPLEPNSPSASESAIESAQKRQKQRRAEEEWWAIVLALVAMLGIVWWVAGRDRFPMGQWMSYLPGVEFADGEGDMAAGDGGDRSLLGNLEADPGMIEVEEPEPTLPAKEFSWKNYVSGGSDNEAEIQPDDTVGAEKETDSGQTAPGADGELQGKTPPPPATDGALEATTTPLPSAPPAPQAFDDVPDGHWAAPFVNQVTQLELIEGFPNNTFRPDEPVTRAQLAAVVAKAYRDRQPAVPAAKFSDVGADFWGLEAIGKTVQIEFMKGYPDSTFNPEKPLPRLEALLTFVAGLKLEPKGDPDAVLGQFPDGDRVPGWARRAIAAAVENKLLANPNSKTLDLSTTATRADIAAIVYQALLSENKVGAVDSPHILEVESQ